MLTGLKAPKDILAGLIFIGSGLMTFYLAHDYQIGTATAMGPGYFPAAAGLVLAGLGVVAIVRGLLQNTPDPITPHRLEPLVLVFAAVLAFALLIDRAGLLVAGAAVIAISCWRRLRSHPLEVLATYVILAGFSALVFVVWFQMQMPLFWWNS